MKRIVGTAVAVLALCGCTPSNGTDDTFVAVQEAVVAADPGVTKATVDQSLDGFSHHLTVSAYIDSEDTNAAQVEAILRAAAPFGDGYDYLDLLVIDPSEDFIDLYPTIVELGFPVTEADNPMTKFTWAPDAIVETLDSTKDGAS